MRIGLPRRSGMYIDQAPDLRSVEHLAVARVRCQEIVLDRLFRLGLEPAGNRAVEEPDLRLVDDTVGDHPPRDLLEDVLRLSAPYFQIGRNPCCVLDELV